MVPEAEGLPQPNEQCPPKYSVHHGGEKRQPPSWTQIFTVDPMALWAIMNTINLTILTSTLVLKTTLPTSMPYFPH
jgi:hypothetical protein